MPLNGDRFKTDNFNNTMKLKHLNGFHLFYRAYVTTRREIVVSLVVLFFVTAVFTLVMWVAESSANPDYTLVDALVWTIVKYVEDPADVAMAPRTLLGQVVGTMVGILGIAIFAVPAGLVGSGLMNAIEEDKMEDMTAKNGRLLHKLFRRIPQSPSWYKSENGLKVTLKGVPRFRSLDYIRVKLGLTEDEIIATVNECPDMRLANLATTQREEDRPQDRVVVAHFPLNREYGCCVDRGSDVTIVAPAAVTELGTGNFAFSLAAMGGFNYVSKELTPHPDDPFGFYTMRKAKLALIDDYNDKEDVESQALHFMADLEVLKAKSAAGGRRHWFIFILATSKSIDCQMHLWRLASDLRLTLPRHKIGDVEYGSTVLAEDEHRLLSLVTAIKERVGRHKVTTGGEEHPLNIRLDDNTLLKSVGYSNIMYRMGGGRDCNALTIRIGYDLLLRHGAHLLVAYDLAAAISAVVEPNHAIRPEERRCFMEEGDGFADEFGREDVFVRDAEKLRKMIVTESRNARLKYEHLDLDGNEEGAQRRGVLRR